jgi:DNA-binding response OmpR family regulator
VALYLLLRGVGGLPPALVVTYLNMPGLDGMSLAEKPRHHWPSWPVVFVSGDHSLAKKPLGSASGC